MATTAKTTYKSTSAYYDTGTNEYYLDLMVNRSIPKNSDDKLFTINQVYDLRPDLLAYDLYGYADLWWVFAQRNPNTLIDPLFDFRQGTQIYLPQLNTLRETLGF
jgi:hypothetical protein